MDEKKKRLLLIILFGVVVVAAALLLTESPPTAAPPVAQSPPAVGPVAAKTSPGPAVLPKAAGTSAAPVLPQGAAGTLQPMRDLFSPPSGYSALQPGTGVAGARGGGGQPNANGSMPALTGVIIGAESRVVILRQGSISRSYRVGESAGSYQVSAIGNSSVTLVGPSGTINLTMGK